MLVSKMYERIKWYKKEYVHDYYSRIVKPFKDYEKITKTKMLEAVYKVYEDYNNIIDICTERELKYLKMILENKTSMEELFDKKYEWERRTLHCKFLIQEDLSDVVFIPDEIIDKVRDAIKNINWNIVKKLDSINEVLVPYCKIQAEAILNTVSAFGSALTGVSEDNLITHMLHNKVFNYYVMVYPKNIEGLGDDIWVTLYQDYYAIEDRLDEERRKQGLAGTIQIDKKKFQTLFYNDFDINNKKISKFLDEIKKLPFFWFKALDIIREFAVLNIDRKSLKDSIASVPSLKNYDLTKFFEILDEAMDEMPSGALNGLTPNEARKFLLEQEKYELEKENSYIKQNNACLSRQDAKLFYKIYFRLLEFTNNKYEIKPGLKIYNKQGINPYDIIDIVETFWENKNVIVLEFCLANPYKFNKEELSITSEFQKGFRDNFIITKHYKEYTAVMSKDRIYMIKGINDNLDNIISFKDLPCWVRTAIIPFKNVLIYDGIINSFEIKMGNGFEKIVMDELANNIKYYHL